MVRLGSLLEDREPDSARGWYEQAAAAGRPDAMTDLALLVMAEDPASARRWLERAAAAGYSDASYNLGVLLLESEHGAARPHFERAAAQGHAAAMNNLGYLEADPGAARRWFERAAVAGDVSAMANLSTQLKEDEPEAALRWAAQAAGAGQREAMFNVYLLSKHSDPGRARYWLYRAAEAGEHRALLLLGFNRLEHVRHGALAVEQAGGHMLRAADDQAPLQAACGWQAARLINGGDLDAALELLEQQERICHQLDAPLGLATSLSYQAMIFEARGDVYGALNLYQREERVLLEFGDLDVALLIHRDVEEICRSRNSPIGVAASLTAQALIQSRSDSETAARLFEDAKELARRHRYPHLVVHIELEQSIAAQPGPGQEQPEPRPKPPRAPRMFKRRRADPE